jgi:hypothetical protein
MPAKIDPHRYTMRDANVVQVHEVEGHTLQETADILNMSVSTVQRTKRRPAYNELAIQAMKDKKRFLNIWTDLMWDGANAEKIIKNEDGDREKVPDHKTRFPYINRALDIYGVDAPKEVDLSGLIAGSSVEELVAAIARAKQKLGMDDGREQSSTDGGSPEEKSGTVL